MMYDVCIVVICSIKFKSNFRPWAKDLALSHDSYHCKNYTNTTPLPTQRIVDGHCNYIGCCEVCEDYNNITYECPNECRPVDHKDWKFC